MAEWYTCKCKECKHVDLKNTKNIKGTKKAYCKKFKMYEDPEHKACRQYFEYNPKSKKKKESETSIGGLLVILVVVAIAAIIVNFFM